MDADKNGTLSFEEVKAFATKAQKLQDPHWGQDPKQQKEFMTQLERIYSTMCDTNQQVSYEDYCSFLSSHPEYSDLFAPPDVFFT